MTQNFICFSNFNHLSSLSTLLFLAGLVSANGEAPRDSTSLIPLYVRAKSETTPWGGLETIVGSQATAGVDASDQVARMPGAAIVRNGPLTGIAQLRGLSGDRVRVRVDGMEITPACPSHMDPPLHYADLEEGGHITLYPGISPVTEGGDRIGGAISIMPPDPTFSERTVFGGDLRASYSGDCNAFVEGGGASVSMTDFFAAYRATGGTAGDLRFPGGKVRDSGYHELFRQSVRLAWRTRGGFVEVNAGTGMTHGAGTPALSMDMVRDNSWNTGVRLHQDLSWALLDARFYVHDIEHIMDNYSLRPKGMMKMKAPARSRDFGGDLRLTMNNGPSVWRTGTDFHYAWLNARQLDDMMGMVMPRDSFKDSRRTTLGAHVDWEHEWLRQWSTRLGARADWVAAHTGVVSDSIMPVNPMIMADRLAFNRAKRDANNVMPGAVAALRYTPQEHSVVELSTAWKERAPSIIERYRWTPAAANAGLTDGRTYMGNPNLDPERAFELALSFSQNEDRWSVGFTPFYQRVFDPIRGVPLARLDSAGLPVLQLRNAGIDELWGGEMEARYDLIEHLSLRGTASYVRGKNQSSGDNLYRIAPLRGLVDLGWDGGSWEAHLETAWADSQNRVSHSVNELPTPGFAIFNLRLSKDFAYGVRVEAGVENLLNHRYAEHLGGINRVTSSDVAVGDHIPSPGRFVYAGLSLKF